VAPTELYALLSPRDVAKLYVLNSAFLLARSARVILRFPSYFSRHAFVTFQLIRK